MIWISMQQRSPLESRLASISAASKILLAQKRRKRHAACSRAAVAAGAGKFEEKASRFCVAAGVTRATVSVTIQPKRSECRVKSGCCVTPERARSTHGLPRAEWALGVDSFDRGSAPAVASRVASLRRRRRVTDGAPTRSQHRACFSDLLGAARTPLRSRRAATWTAGLPWFPPVREVMVEPKPRRAVFEPSLAVGADGARPSSPRNAS